MDGSNCINGTQPGGLSVIAKVRSQQKGTDNTADVPMEKPVPTPESSTKISTITHDSSYPLLVETSARTKVYIMSVKTGNDCDGPAPQCAKMDKNRESSNSPACLVAKTTTVQYVVKTDGSFDILDDQQVPVEGDSESPTANSDNNEPIPKKRKIDKNCISGSCTGMPMRRKLNRAIHKPRRFIEQGDCETQVMKNATKSRSIKGNSKSASLPTVHIDSMNASKLSSEIEIDNLVLGQFEKLLSPKDKSLHSFNVAKVGKCSTDVLNNTAKESPKLSKKCDVTDQKEIEETVESPCLNKFVKSEIDSSVTERGIKTKIEPGCSNNDLPNEEMDCQGLAKNVEDEEERLKKEEREIDEADASDDYVDVAEEVSMKWKSKKKTAKTVKKQDPNKPKRQHIRGRWKEVVDEYDYSPHYTIVKQKIAKGDKQVTRCNMCDKYESNNLFNMKEHIRSHTGLKPFICQHCNKSFHSQSYHLKHERGHLNIRPFICEICHLGFKERRYLEIHTNRHLGLKNYVCHVCARSFYTVTELKIHSDKHSDMQKYECPTCEKKFRNSSSYYRHKLMHTSLGKHHCNFCGKTFHRKEYYIMHLQKVHSDLNIQAIIEAIPNKRNNFSVRKLISEEEESTNFMEMSPMSKDTTIVVSRNAGSQTDNLDEMIVLNNATDEVSMVNDDGMVLQEGTVVYEITFPEGDQSMQFITVHNSAF